MKYHIAKKDLNDFSPQDADTHLEDPNSLSFKGSLDLTKVRQLQQHDTHISEIITKCKPKKCNKTLYYMDKQGTAYRKIKDGPHIFHTVMVPQT